MDACTREALGFANEVRRALGLRPVAALSKGRRMQGERCPLARTITAGEAALSCAVDADRVVVWVGEQADGLEAHSFAVRDTVAHFIERFDARAYPELEAR
ncbi:MAG: hypothetical protein GEU88_18810 [Solirubrobacterales bacterium]|nr:hypothetical protein [Solirubrobacterales bacterium]